LNGITTGSGGLNMSGGDRLIKFEENNFDWLIEAFLKTKVVAPLWYEFVENEYEKSFAEPDEGDDKSVPFTEEVKEPDPEAL
jgi:hypothetical protein